MTIMLLVLILSKRQVEENDFSAISHRVHAGPPSVLFRIHIPFVVTRMSDTGLLFTIVYIFIS